MKDFLKKLITRKNAQLDELKTQLKASATVEETRSIGETLMTLKDEIADAEAQLKVLEEEPAQEEGRSMKPLNSYAMPQPVTTRSEDNIYSTIEYRKAFKDYVQKGTPIPEEYRVGNHPGETTSTVVSDLGAIIPETIMNEFIKGVDKVRGNIFDKVRKINVKGGVKFPIAELGASFRWVGESTAPRKNAGNIGEYVVFDYKLGEARIAQSLLSQVVSLDIFESEITKALIEAYLFAMDRAILSGEGENDPLGIFRDPKCFADAGENAGTNGIDSKHIVYMTEEEFGDWETWRKKVFAKIPLSKRGQGEFLMTPATVESYLMTMKDLNNRPIFKEATELTMDNLAGSFFGRPLTLIEPSPGSYGITDMGTADGGECVALFWNPQDYVINTNMEFGVKRYFDEETNQWVNKALTIVDGKLLTADGVIVILKQFPQEEPTLPPDEPDPNL